MVRDKIHSCPSNVEEQGLKGSGGPYTSTYYHKSSRTAKKVDVAMARVKARYNCLYSVGEGWALGKSSIDTRPVL